MQNHRDRPRHLALTLILSCAVMAAACTDGDSDLEAVTRSHDTTIEDDTAGGDVDIPDTAPPLDTALPPADTAPSDTGPPPADTAGPAPIDPALIAVSVRTEAPAAVSAGQLFSVSCTLENADGDPVSPPEGARTRVSIAPSAAVAREAGDNWMAAAVGTLRARCTVPDLYLIDDIGALIDVRPGPPAHVVTHLDRATTIAGEAPTQVACEVFDAFGNPLPDDNATVVVTPSADEQIDDREVSITVAGDYEVSCDVPGATGGPEPLRVLPNLPASFSLARSPSDPVVATGTIITLHPTVADRYGNLIDAVDILYTSRPSASETLGDGRYALDTDGTYQLMGLVFGDTDASTPLQDTLTVVVNGSGPTISCQSGVMKNINITKLYPFTGSVSDPSGVSRVTVNGATALLNANGVFSRSITPRFGMNFIEVIATDVHGVQTSRLCTLLLSDYWVGRTSYLKQSVMVRLDQAAIDDGNRSGVDNSLGDVVDTVLDSNAFENYIEALVIGQGTSGSMCLGIGAWGTCIGGTVSWNIKIDRLTINGNSSVSLDLKSGNKIGMSATLRNVDIRLRITGTLNTYVTAKVSSLTLWFTGTTSLSSGKINFDVTSGPSASVNATLDSSLPDWIDSIINSFVQGRVESEVEKAVEAAAKGAIEPLLDGVLGNLDVGSFGGSLSVPKLAGGSATLTVGLKQESLSVDDSRLLVGISTRITSPSNVVSAPTLGVPLPTSSAYTSASGSKSARVAVHIGLINQALHTLWKAGFLDGNLNNLAGSALPSGASVRLASTLPPVARLRSGGVVELGLGGLRLTVELPGLFEGADALVAEVGALIRTTPSMSGNELRFSAPTLTEFFFTTDGANLDPTTRETLEDLFRELMAGISETALNDALPALPIPEFKIPSNDFGLTGTFLLYNPTLTRTTNHFVLSGDMRRQ